MSDGRIQESTYDREKCHSRAQTYGIGSFQKGLLQIVNEDDPERRRTMIYSDFFTKSLQSIGLLPRLDRPVLRVHARLPGRAQVPEARMKPQPRAFGEIDVSEPPTLGRAGPHGPR